MRTAIIGGPGCGKTTTAHLEFPGVRTYSTDDVKHLPWADQAYFWLSLQYCPGPWVLEGVQAVRVLRKGLRVDRVIELWEPHVELTARQMGMMKGIKKIWEEIKPCD